MEFLSQYDTSINCILGSKNFVTDALSHLPQPFFYSIASIFSSPSLNKACKTTLTLDSNLLSAIKTGYSSDPFITKLTRASASLDIVKQRDGFWFINDCLVISNIKHVCEILFHLTHDNLGHFSSNKSMTALRNSFYWPNMHQDLETAYIPLCPACQVNKSKTTKPIGPLHPLPIPDG
jgi:hypothetical protein